MVKKVAKSLGVLFVLANLAAAGLHVQNVRAQEVLPCTDENACRCRITGICQWGPPIGETCVNNGDCNP
jgi:hypothetical protein